MDTAINPQQEAPNRQKIVRIVASILMVIIGLSTGAAIVHGMVLQQCQVKKDTFEAGVLPDDVQVQKEDSNDGNVDLQKCVNQEDVPFQAGVLPEESAGLAGEPETSQPSVQGSTPVAQPAKTVPAVTQTAAPAPAPTPAPADPKLNIINITPPKPTPAPAPAPKPATPAPAKKTTTTSTKSKTLGVDLDKLSMAVAMTETHNCQDDRGSALYNNCHGFRKNGQFMHFNSTAESHAYFKQLWARSYGGFPTYRQAQIYSGNDHPNNWLKNVTYYYNKL